MYQLPSRTLLMGLTTIGLLASSILIPGNTMQAQEPEKITQIEGITEYKLHNGVQVLLFPDDSKPQFTVNMTVLVGSRHEGYGETGMAHLLEHMLFKGTEVHPDIPKLLKDRGVLNMNGTTWFDRTNYYETLPASNENLDFAIKMEADRLVNSLIKGEDLASEMTVVRNEFEMGENSPLRILMQRIMSTAYEWHNYGKSTIGNRSDIERVPVSNLREFYRKFYQPDNLMVVVAGKFDEKKALQYLNKYFGSLEVPQRELPKTYTEEPAQDGERTVLLRRTGDTQMVGVGYHIPPASHPDYAAIQVLTTILGMEPSGPLYKALVETKIASSVTTMDIAGHDPGMILAFSEVPMDGDLEKARDVLLQQIEKVGVEGADSAMVKRAIQRLESNRERQFANTSQFAINLSEWRAYGDWRLYFLHRDRIEKVTPSDVKRVAAEYLVQSNRTVGMFVPTDSPVRAPIKTAPKLNELLADYKGRKAISKGEAFEATPENIDARTELGELNSGIRYALLPKKTRGERVFFSLRLQYGDQENLKGLITATELLPAMLGRGTESMSFSEFKDRLDELKASLRFGGSTGVLTVNIQTKRENFLEVLGLMQDAIRKPALSAKELEVIKREQTTQLESGKSDPQMLAFNQLQRKLSPYQSDNVRYVPTIDEKINNINSVTLQQIKELSQKYLNGQHGEIAIVGDFDPKESIKELQNIFANWKSEKQVARVASPSISSPGERIDIKTPDKKNAIYAAGISLPLKEDNPDYESLLIGNYILGGGPLSSRLADRVRKKDGLSYGVGSMLNAHPIDESGVFIMQAISNPQNTPKVVAAIDDELTRMLESGVTLDELERAKASYLQNRQGGRAQDQRLVGMLINNLRTDRTMKFQQESDTRIANLTKEQVDDTIRKYVEPKKLIIITAGDFDAANKEAPDNSEQNKAP